jgi:urease accessory protein
MTASTALADDTDSIDWLAALLQTTDSTYPIGGFSHSGGLEGMVGLEWIGSIEDLRRFLHQQVAETLANVELPSMHMAWEAADQQDDALLTLLDDTSEAVRFSAEQRLASRRLGSQRWTLLEKLHARRATEEWQARLSILGQHLPYRHLCVVGGVEAHMLGIPISAAMVALCHQTVSMVGQAAMKIMRIGQTSVQTLLTEMTLRYPHLVVHAKSLELDEVGASLPVLDIATAWHETANARMFLS